MMTPNFAKRSLHSLVAIALGAGTALSLASSALAQSTNAQPLQEFKPQEQQSQDIFSNNGSGQPSGLLNLIHQANFGNIRSINEFRSGQTENINDEAAKFRAQQMQRLKPQPPVTAPAATPDATPTTPTTGTPGQ